MEDSPIAVATSALAILAAGSAINSYLGSRSAAGAAKTQGEYEASILERNAGFAGQQAKDAISLGQEQVSDHAAAVRGLIGTQRTDIGASGIAIDSGSAKDIQEEAATLGALDELRIRNNARRQAWGYQVEASNYLSQAALTRAGAKNVAQSYRNQGYSTLLTGGAQIASMYPGSSFTVPRSTTNSSGGMVVPRRVTGTDRMPY